jgi:CCR4-NOT transcription complex subunit 1
MDGLFAECRNFPKFPPAHLKIAGEVFGKCIEHGLIPEKSMPLALRSVFEALKRPASSMFVFGVTALEQVLGRAAFHPAFCVGVAAQRPGLGGGGFADYAAYFRELAKASGGEK